MRALPRIPDGEPLRDPDLFRFWVGESVAMLGAQVSLLAIPLAAVLVLDATPVELGVLRAAAFVPFLLVILPAGAWIDRVRRRPVLLAANVGRAIALAVVPAASITGALSLPLLIVVAGTVGVLTVLFDVAYVSYLPSLVSTERLTSANARLQMSQSSAQIGGPGLAGLLVGAIGAPIAIAVDAASLVLAAVAIGRIRTPEPEPEVAAERRALRRSVAEGFRFVVSQPILRALAGEAGMFNMLWSGAQVAFLLYATRDLGFSPTVLGLALSMGSIGSLIGSLTIGRLEGWLGYGRALCVVMVLGTVPFVGLAVAAPGPFAFWTVVAAMFVGSFGVGGAIVLVVTLRQTATPPDLLGRAAATYRLLTYGVIPIGAVLGGVLVEAVGPRGALLACTVGIAFAPAWIFRSPLPRITRIGDVVLRRPTILYEGTATGPDSLPHPEAA